MKKKGGESAHNILFVALICLFSFRAYMRFLQKLDGNCITSVSYLFSISVVETRGQVQFVHVPFFYYSNIPNPTAGNFIPRKCLHSNRTYY